MSASVLAPFHLPVALGSPPRDGALGDDMGSSMIPRVSGSQFTSYRKVHLRHVMREAGLPEVRFRFDLEGSKLVVQS